MLCPLLLTPLSLPLLNLFFWDGHNTLGCFFEPLELFFCVVWLRRAHGQKITLPNSKIKQSVYAVCHVPDAVSPSFAPLPINSALRNPFPTMRAKAFTKRPASLSLRS